MKTEQQNVSEDLTKRNTRAETSINGGERIPVDLIVKICSRLPAKSVSRCRCVSKLWASILSKPYFTDMFLTRSLARPQLLFACRKDKQVFFFSSSQPQNLDDNNSSLLAAYQMKAQYYAFRCSSVRGLIFVDDEMVSEGRTLREVSVICNPSTGQSLTIPRLETKTRVGLRSYLGYDPIQKQYKVLSLTGLTYGLRVSEEHQVLTLGTKELSWRRIECSIPHSLYTTYSHVCINGVLYYPAVNTSSGDCIIVYFDVRSEKFGFIKETSIYGYFPPLMINYNGKLGALEYPDYISINGSCARITFRVLEDAEKQAWSEHIYELPTWWNNIVGRDHTELLCFVGVTRTNEIVLSLSLQAVPFYVFYFNTERNTIKRVQIQGMEAFERLYVYTFLDYVEDMNMKLLEVF